MVRALPEHRAEISAQAPWLAPARAFPLQALWCPVLVAAIVASSAFTVALARGASFPGRLPALIALGLLIGLIYSSLAFFTHELLHGSILKMDRPLGRAITRAMAFCGFVIFTLSPELWLIWHNAIHHFHTNEPKVDPDCFGLWEDFQRFPVHEFALKRSPGSGHWLSYVHYPLNFSTQVVNVTWYHLFQDRKLFGKINRPRVVAETLSMYAFWAFVLYSVGGFAFLFVFVIPALVGNVVLSSYILVQHLLCPMTEINDPFENTLGVSGPAWLERIHFRFGYHIEHHLYPEANHSWYPRLRAHLREKYLDRYRIMSHARALGLILKTPRVYKDHGTLFDPWGSRQFQASQTGR